MNNIPVTVILLFVISNLTSTPTAYAGNEESYYKACDAGEIVSINKYLAEGVDINYVYANSGTCMTVAAARGNTPLVKLLIEHNADVNYRPRDAGNAAIHMAVYGNHLDTVKVLLDAGASVELTGDGYTPLGIAAGYGYIEVAQALLAAGADINRKDQYHYTPLMLANFNEQKEMSEFLLKHGADRREE